MFKLAFLCMHKYVCDLGYVQGNKIEWEYNEENPNIRWKIKPLKNKSDEMKLKVDCIECIQSIQVQHLKRITVVQGVRQSAKVSGLLQDVIAS